MAPEDQRAALMALAEKSGDSLSRLSRLLGRNAAYLQQFVQRGTPRLLSETDRETLARWFGVDEAELGGPVRAPEVQVPRLDVAAAAGAGALADDRPAEATVRFDPAFLRSAGISARALAMIAVQGDSMLPTLEHGDTILVDTDDRRGGPGIHVLRLDGALVVKRIARTGEGVRLLSDNPAFDPVVIGPADRLDIVGRVVWLSRRI